MRKKVSLALAVVFATMSFGAGSLVTQAQSFADPAFQTTWERTDGLVASGAVKRSFYWGPAPLAAQTEPYAEGQEGKRLVQYFDKSRMEINNPAGNKSDPFYVTNGLLTVELITGRMQVGNSQYTDRYPAEIPLASDSDDAAAPTYASFGRAMGRAADNMGKAVPLSIDRTGATIPATVAGYAAEQAGAHFESTTGHNVPKVFWDFLNASGPVLQNGKSTTARLSDPWFYAAGLPITEAYWAKVKIGGRPNTDVLIQAFQRRVLTFVPSLPKEFQVQMGNIGLHYYDWRYKDAGHGSGPTQGTPPATPPTQPTTTGSGSNSIAITGAVKAPLTLTAADLAGGAAITVQTNFTLASGGTEQHSYKGRLLLDLLKSAGGDGNGGRDLPIRYIVATGQGGQRVVLSWGEIDPIFAGRQVVVAYQQDGANLSGAQGFARLVIPSDKSGARSLYSLTGLEVKTISPTKPTGTMLKITGAVPNPLSLTAADLPSRNPQTVQVRYMAGGITEAHTYKGVLLMSLLAEAGLRTSIPPTADALTRYVVAAGNDGRNAVISWGEFDPALSGTNAMVAYEENSVPLGGGLTRLVVPSDARGGRYLPYLLSLDVRNDIGR